MRTRMLMRYRLLLCACLVCASAPQGGAVELAGSKVTAYQSGPVVPLPPSGAASINPAPGSMLSGAKQVRVSDANAAPPAAPSPTDKESAPANGEGKAPAGAGEATPAVPARPQDKAEISPLEKTFNAEDYGIDKYQSQKGPEKNLTQFGYDFFAADAKGFAPFVDVPVGPDYVVGPGDRIAVNLWGSVEGAYEMEVSRSGEIVLPRAGAVKVWGTPFGKLPELIRANLSKHYIDFQLNVNLGKLRMMKVYVVGDVRSPGDYNVSSLSTLINALGAAGGPTKNGSLRAIQVKRGEKLVDTVDLYDFFLRGDKSRDVRLQSGDTVYVPHIGRTVGVSGSVRRPAIFELKDEATLKDIVSLAEGITPDGYLKRVQIVRVEAHEKKIVTDVNIDPKAMGGSVEEAMIAITMDKLMAAMKIQDMDMVKVFSIDATLRGYARLEGHVLRPGDYAIQPGMRISSLLAQENLLPELYREAGVITRLYPPDYHPEKIYFNVGGALSGFPQDDLELREFDRIRLFSRWEMEEMPKVRIGGEVQAPGEYRLLPNMTVRDLVIQAGNPKITAYFKNAEINRIRKTGEAVAAFPVIINLEEAMKGNPKENIALAPFDELTIRRIPNWAEETDRYVSVKGEFVFPGVYPVFKGERLSAVIERAGGFTDKAYLKGITFTRESVRELQQKRMTESLVKAENDILTKQTELASASASKEELEANRAALESLKKQVELLKTKKAEGRIIIHVDSLAALKGSKYDVEVKGGDTLTVPGDPKTVHVIGQVYNPSSMLFTPNEDVSYYLDAVGGVTKDADAGDMYLVRANGMVISKQQSSEFLFYNSFPSREVESGDTIVVPQRYEKTALMRDLKDIATILGQLALTGGVLVAAGL